jgi:hypothetical protein
MRKSFDERVYAGCKVLGLPREEWDRKVWEYTWEDELGPFGRSAYIHWVCWEALALDKVDELIEVGAVAELEARRAISPYNTRRYVEQAGGPEEDHTIYEKGIDYSISRGWIEKTYRERMDLTSCGGWRYPAHPPK